MEGVYDSTIKLPTDWTRRRLGDVFTVIRGASPRPKGDPRYFGGNIPWIMISDITREKGKYLSQTRDQVTEEGATKSRFLPAGTLILSNSGTVCVPKILAVDGCIHDGFVAFPDLPSDFDILYLYYYFDFIRPRIINAHRQGITQVNLNTEIVKNIQLPIPPLDQQKRIVAEIEKQFSRLDEAVANLKRVKANLKRYKAAVLKAAVEGRLVETEAELARREGRSYETGEQLLQRILETRRSQWQGKGKYKEPTAANTTDLPELPEGWVWARLDAIAVLKGGITVDSKRQDPTARPVPYFRVANVQRGYLDLSEIKTINAPLADIEELRLRVGDILFNEGGDRDKLGRGWVWEGQLADCIHQNHVFRARLVSADILPKFVSWWGNSFGKDYFQREGKQTTNLASINLTKLSSFPIPLPPFAEQHRIVAEVDRRLSILRETEAQVDVNLKRAERLRQSILSNAFSGLLVPEHVSHGAQAA